MRKARFALAVSAAVAAVQADAYQTEMNGFALQLDTKLSAGVAVRTDQPNAELIGIGNGGSAYSTNGDDGNLAFGQGEAVAGALKVTADLTISRGAWGLFTRGSYVHSPVLNNYEFFNPNNYNPPNATREVPRSEFEERTRAVQGYVGSDFDLLDAYVFGTVDLGFSDLALRLGRQVINWGESTFVLNGINSILAFDANQSHVPGWELDEVIIPSANLWLSMGLAKGISLEGFYQLDWQRSRPDAAGTFWSTSDFVGTGGTRANIRFGLIPENTPGTTIPRAPDVEPGSTGQFGARLGFIVEPLNSMDLSLYAMNYHSRLPLFSGTSATLPQTAFGATYFAEYPEDIQLYGISFNTTVGDASVQGEYSYKVDQPLQVDDVELLLTGLGIPSQLDGELGHASGNKYLRGWRRHDVSQFDLGVTYILGPSAWLGYDQMVVVGEAAGIYVHELPPTSELAYEGPGTYTPNGSSPSLPFLAALRLPVQEQGYPTRGSYGYKLVARASYENVLNRFKVDATLRFDHDVHGITPTPLNNFVEKRKSTTASVSALFRQAWQAEIGYTLYYGAGRQNLLHDRDFAEVVLRYSF